MSDLVFVGLDEAEQLWGAEDAQAVRQLIPHPSGLVVKDGSRRAIEWEYVIGGTPTQKPTPTPWSPLPPAS